MADLLKNLRGTRGLSDLGDINIPESVEEKILLDLQEKVQNVDTAKIVEYLNPISGPAKIAQAQARLSEAVRNPSIKMNDLPTFVLGSNATKAQTKELYQQVLAAFLDDVKKLDTEANSVISQAINATSKAAADPGNIREITFDPIKNRVIVKKEKWGC